MQLICKRHPSLAKEPTLFIHGNLASTVWWEPTVAEWKRLGSLGSGDLLLADWRGCGQNPTWPRERVFSLEDLAMDFIETLEREKITQAALVGHSLGGLIALQMMILRPGLFTKCALLDSVGPRGVVFDESMYEAFRQMALSRDLTKTVILSTIHRADQIAPEFTERLAEDAFHAVQGIGSSVLEILKNVDLREPLRNVLQPTLILHGELDTVIERSAAEQLSAGLAKSELEFLPNCGHCWNIEAPVAFTERLRRWL